MTPQDTPEISTDDAPQPAAKQRRLLVALGIVGVIGVVAVVILLTRRTMTDDELRAAIIGRWRALDVTNSSLHQRKDTVISEEIEIRRDGTLEYDITLPPEEGKPIADPYAWEIVRGKLQLRYTGPGATGDMLPRLKVIVRDSRLSIPRSGYPVKEFERIPS